MSETSTKLELDSIVALNKNLMSCDIESDKVVLEVDSGQYYNLNETAKRICNILVSPMSVNSLIDTVAAMHDVSKDQCQQDMLPFLNDLYKSNLIQIVKD